jgi:hypothetical protein
VNVTIVHNTYNQTVVNNVTVVNRVSFNGGAGGISAVPSAQERMAAQEQHVPPTPAQRQHVQQAASNPALSAKANGGRPAIAATARAGAFSGPGVVGARGAPASAPQRPAVANANDAHAGPGGRGGAANGAHPAPYSANAHPQPANANRKPPVNGKPPASKPNTAQSHPKKPPEKAHPEGQTTAQR